MASTDTLSVRFPIDEVVEELERYNLTETELDRALSTAARRALAAGRDRALREIGSITGEKNRKYWNPLNSPSGGKPNRVRWRVGSTSGDAKLWVGLNEVRVKRYRLKAPVYVQDSNPKLQRRLYGQLRLFRDLPDFTGRTARDVMVQVYHDTAIQVAEKIVRGGI